MAQTFRFPTKKPAVGSSYIPDSIVIANNSMLPDPFDLIRIPGEVCKSFYNDLDSPWKQE